VGFQIRRKTTPPRHCRVVPSFTGGQSHALSPPRRGGVARSDGVVRFQIRRKTTPPRRRRVVPSFAGGQSHTHSPPRRGATVLVPGLEVWIPGCISSCHGVEDGQDLAHASY